MSDNKLSSSPCSIDEFSSAYTGLFQPAELQAFLRQLLDWEQAVVVSCRHVEGELPHGTLRDLIEDIHRRTVVNCGELGDSLQDRRQEPARDTRHTDPVLPDYPCPRIARLLEQLARISDCLAENIPKISDAQQVSWLNGLAAQIRSQLASLRQSMEGCDPPA